MTTSSRQGEKERTCFHVALISWALAALGMIWAVSFNISTYHTAMLEAREYQKDKAQEMATQLRSYFYVATQLAESLQVFVEHYEGHDKKQIEQYLDYFLASAPPNFIYGTGIWWEPFAFDPAVEHFGPYAYRSEPGASRILTYEWNTAAYDYHSQFWYRAAVSEEVMVTDPYLDKGVAYISLMKTFHDLKTGQKKGVISVDMVVAQMQKILLDIKTRPSDILMILGKTGHVIAHSAPEELMKQARARHPELRIERMLDVGRADAMAGHEEHLTHSNALTRLGWTVVIISQPDELLADYHKSRLVIALAAGVYLMIVMLGYFTICYFLRSLERQRENFLYTEKMASLGEMAGSIAHEINNPLAIIQGAAQKLQIRLRHEELNREDLKQTVHMILKTSERIARIIRSLRFVARDGSTDPFVNTSIRSIVDETLALCDSRLKNENVCLDASAVPVDLSCVCRGVQISQVLINLINNAVDAIRDRPEKWIRIEASLQAGMIRIAVTDSGPGIPKELADKIMKPFFTTKGVGKGTGLGLSISRGIAHAHGGDLELDEGSPHTRFVLVLPQAHESLQTA
ncbi:MAG TPA: ATP-binding protein [Oligoflexus sp.]|uniref:ATP-binding protein n=1 Tax=Oligoflexus sp. TaxID=1971216 RepID=UPI002D7FCD3F|nr:ATP-binding protein [Oligoflexus sp.]HET9238619.1 ATP-binding protein [Oligoflexus sp.]